MEPTPRLGILGARRLRVGFFLALGFDFLWPTNRYPFMLHLLFRLRLRLREPTAALVILAAEVLDLPFLRSL